MHNNPTKQHPKYDGYYANRVSERTAAVITYTADTAVYKPRYGRSKTSFLYFLLLFNNNIPVRTVSRVYSVRTCAVCTYQGHWHVAARGWVSRARAARL